MKECPTCHQQFQDPTQVCPQCRQPLSDVPAAEENRNISASWFSFEGRLNRRPYFAMGILLNIAGAVIEKAAALMGAPWLLLLFVPALLAMLSISIRRCHDVNKSGWWVTVPLLTGFAGALLGIEEMALLGIAAYMIFSLYLLFAKGTTGNNRYGADPLRHEQP